VILCSQLKHLTVTVCDNGSSSSSWSASRHSVTAEYEMTSTGEIKLDETLACVRCFKRHGRWSRWFDGVDRRPASLPCEELVDIHSDWSWRYLVVRSVTDGGPLHTPQLFNVLSTAQWLPSPFSRPRFIVLFQLTTFSRHNVLECANTSKSNKQISTIYTNVQQLNLCSMKRRN